MADSNETIDKGSIYLEPCENGYILCWTCTYTVPGPSGGVYDTRTNYEDNKEVFGANESAKAIKRMDELYAGDEEDE